MPDMAYLSGWGWALWNAYNLFKYARIGMKLGQKVHNSQKYLEFYCLQISYIRNVYYVILYKKIYMDFA
jgi:hypothetical protein